MSKQIFTWMVYLRDGRKGDCGGIEGPPGLTWRSAQRLDYQSGFHVSGDVAGLLQAATICARCCSQGTSG